MEKVIVVARSFQSGTGPGAGGKPFNQETFGKLVVAPIKRILQSEAIQSIIVVVNAEPGNNLAEIPDSQGITPTMGNLKARFPEEVEASRIIIFPCTNWGLNPGSANALNWGLDIARHKGVSWILNWSSEIEMDQRRIELGLTHAERHNLPVVGFLRQNWWERPQWAVPQNTACFWKTDLLLKVDDFSPECNGTGRIIKTVEYGDVPVAGMEDFHTLLKMLKRDGDIRWGMVGRAEPLFWDTDFQGERLATHLKKVARQYQVMQIWAKDIFPELSFNQVMNRLFTCCHID